MANELENKSENGSKRKLEDDYIQSRKKLKMVNDSENVSDRKKRRMGYR